MKNLLPKKDELVLRLLISYNEDRQISSLSDLNITEKYSVEDMFIIIETIGKFLDVRYRKTFTFYRSFEAGNWKGI